MINEEMREVIKNSFLADLEDALEVETDPAMIDAINDEIKRRKAHERKEN
jgi:hypothetical protein